MTLEVDGVRVGTGEPVSATVPAGAWERVAHPDPPALIAAVCGLAPAPGRVALDGRSLAGADAAARVRRGLAVCTARLPPLAGLRVLDVLLLGRQGDADAGWRAALGSPRARERLEDAEALARNLAGRLGVAAWADEPAVHLPAPIAALVDLGRAVMTRPRVIVWRAPEWLAGHESAAAGEVLAHEQSLAGWGVLEVRRAPSSGTVIEVGSSASSSVSGRRPE